MSERERVREREKGRERDQGSDKGKLKRGMCLNLSDSSM